MREKHRRDNYLAFQNLPWAQEVSGSNPEAPTNIFCDLKASRKSPSPHDGRNSGDLLHHPHLFLCFLHLHRMIFLELHYGFHIVMLRDFHVPHRHPDLRVLRSEPIAPSPSFPLLLASSPHDISRASLRLPHCNAPRFSRTASSSRSPSARGFSAKSSPRSPTIWIGLRTCDADCRGPWRPGS